MKDPIERVLSNSEDEAAIARMQARLEASLGAAFDMEVERPSAERPSSHMQRVRWLGATAIVAVGVAVWTLRPSPQLQAAELAPPRSEEPQLLATEEPTPAPLLATEEPTPSELPPRTRSSDESRAQRPAVERRRLKLSPSKQTANPAAESGSPSAPQLGLAEELRGLDQIRALLAESPERALAAAHAQERQFPRGVLAPERALLRLDALLRLRRTAEAQQLAQQLLAADESRPYRARIRQLLARTP